MNMTHTRNTSLILIVDDDKPMRLRLRRAMEQGGYQVEEASDGAEGLAVYARLRPDLVLMDTSLPVMDGFTCCTKLRLLPGGNRTPVLMLTALDSQELARAFESGATDYITKPIHWVALRQRVDCVLQASRATAELQRQNLQSQLFAEVTLKIRQSLQIEEILQTTVKEVQRILQADRVLIYRIWPDGSGRVVEEAVIPGQMVILGQDITDHCFAQTLLEQYRRGRISVIADLEQADVQTCYAEFLQQFGIKANLVVPILLKEELWGLLLAHQCTTPRQWFSFETELLQHLANQIGVALAQAQLLEQEISQRQELARSNAELQQFASIASHDLQEPLRKIQAFGDRLKTSCDEVLTVQERDYLERMQSAAQRMQALIDDLLSFSRVATRAQPFVQVDLAQVTQEVLSDLEVRIQQTVGQVIVGELPTIAADPVQMRQLLQNLISNALKFHRDEPPIVRIWGELKQSLPVRVNTVVEWQITVQDNGIGFDQKYVDRIFQAFQRLHGRSAYEGTGMGLTICRKIVERHSGSITATSMPGEGTAFIVTLPVQQP